MERNNCFKVKRKLDFGNYLEYNAQQSMHNLNFVRRNVVIYM